MPEVEPLPLAFAVFAEMANRCGAEHVSTCAACLKLSDDKDAQADVLSAVMSNGRAGLTCQNGFDLALAAQSDFQQFVQSIIDAPLVPPPVKLSAQDYKDEARRAETLRIMAKVEAAEKNA